MNLAEKIKTLRIEKEMTQEQLADMTGLKRWSIANYENGNRVPHKKNLAAIAEALGTTVEILSDDNAELRTEDEVIDYYGKELLEKYGETAKNGFKKMVKHGRPMFAGGLMPEQDRDKYIAAVAATYMKFCEKSIERYGKIVDDDYGGE